jgi:hypothetical protein
MTSKTILLFCSLLICCISSLSLHAQVFSFEDVSEIKLKDIGPIFQGHTLKGYYAFYYIDDVDKRKLANFKLILLDENLNKIAEKKMVESQYINLQMVAYDGKDLLVVFHNDDSKQLEYRHCDLKLNELSKSKRDLDAIEDYFFTNPYDGIQHVPPHILTIEGKGFVLYNFTGNGGVRPITEFIPNTGKPAWKREKEKNDPYGQLPNALCYNDKLLLHNFTDWNRPSAYLQAINLETGKDAFFKEMTIDHYDVQVLHAYPDSMGNFVVIGQYYTQNSNINKVSSLGIVIGKINPAGNFIEHKYLTWAKDIAAKVKIDEEGMIDGRGYPFFQNAVHTKDGRLYLCGELFSLAGSRLGRGARVQDFLILEINPDLTLNSVKIIDKKEKHIDWTTIALTGNPLKLANTLRLNDGFDYQYTQLDDAANAFTFFYRAIEKKDGKTISRKLCTASKHMGDPGFETDVITMGMEAGVHKTLPAKAGHLLLIDYYKETKKLDMRIEKFNY